MTKTDCFNKSRLSFFLSLVFSFFFGFQSQVNAHDKSEGIEFLPMSLNEAKTFAASTQKLIFIDCYTTWCGPCKWMSANIFTNDTVAQFYNRNFLCLKMDMEKGEGKSIARKYKVKAYPTLLFLDQDGNIQERFVGASRTTMDYIDLGLLAMNPFENLRGHQISYESGAKSNEFLASYLEKLSNAGMATETVLDSLYSSWTDSDFTDSSNFKLYSKYDQSIDSKAFKYVLSNYKWYKSNFGDKADTYLQTRILWNHSLAVRRKVKAQLKAINEIMKMLPETKKGEMQWLMEDSELRRVEDPKPYIKHAIRGAKDYSWDNAELLNSMAWYIYKNSKNEDDLNAGLEMSNRSIALSESPAFLDTKSSLLFELGRKDEAISNQQKAVELAKKNKDDVKSYQETLEFFKNKK